jgi:hypothetical protein
VLIAAAHCPRALGRQTRSFGARRQLLGLSTAAQARRFAVHKRHSLPPSVILLFVFDVFHRSWCRHYSAEAAAVRHLLND